MVSSEQTLRIIATAVGGVLIATLRQQLIPDRLQGRVNVTARMIAWAGQPIGAALGGVIADVTSIRVSFLVMGLGAAASTVYAWSSVLRTIDADTLARLKEDADHAA